jgi:hypothetical protein
MLQRSSMAARSVFWPGASLQARPPEFVALEGGHAPPAAQRGGVGARRPGRIAGSPLEHAGGVARVLPLD